MKLFQRLLVAPAALGLLAPVSANANEINLNEISNYSDEKTLDLIDELMEHVNSLKFEYRHKWEVGDFVIWDNRTLMHKANGDYDMSEKRYLYRLMLQDN